MVAFWKKKEVSLPTEEWFDQIVEQKKKNFSLNFKTIIPLSKLEDISQKANFCFDKLEKMSYINHYKDLDFTDLKEKFSSLVEIRGRNEMIITKGFFRIKLEEGSNHYSIFLKDKEKEMPIASGNKKPRNSYIAYERSKVNGEVTRRIERKELKRKDPEKVESYVKKRAEQLITPHLLKSESLIGNIQWITEKEEPWMDALRVCLNEINNELDILFKKINKRKDEFRKRQDEEFQDRLKEKERTENHFREIFARN